MFRVKYLALICAVSADAAMLVEQPGLGVKVAEGFRVRSVAGSNLVGDLAAMTLDSKGRPVVAGAGYIKTLVDRDGDGKMDDFKLFAQPQSAPFALCFDGNDLLVMARDGVWKYTDSNGDGVADGPPEKFLAANYGERGGHAMHLGPDGWWYFICGNDSGLGGTGSAGALIRISRDGKERQEVADGFCNPRDFAFNAAGDIFTYDADIERDFFLPWYTPTRIYHVALGQHHGWLLDGDQRSWNRPEYYPDSVEILVPVGRGEPCGVVVYRHNQFPAEYRDGLFACDAQFGKIYFCKLQKQGATYRPRLDVFLEAQNARNFIPLNLCVAPDGSLLLAARRGVFRIQDETERGASLSQPTKIQEVLRATQPLEAWSRAKWTPAAQQLGADAFARAVNDTSLTDSERVRAVEIHVDLFGALPQSALEPGAAAKSSDVRARIAWAMARQVSDQNSIFLQRLALDVDGRVRRCALESILACEEKLNLKPFMPILRQSLDHPDKRLHQAAARICARLPDLEWQRLWESETAHSVQTELSLLLAALWRTNPPVREEITERAMETISLASQSQRVDALRVTTIALGDWNLKNPSVETFAGYELARPVSEEVSTNLLPLVRRLLPAADPMVDLEATRLLAMLEDDSPETPQKIERFLQGLVSPTTTFHYLAVLSKLRAPWPDSLPQVVADSIHNFDSQFAERDRPERLNWPERLDEVVRALEAKEPRLANFLAEKTAISPPP